MIHANNRCVTGWLRSGAAPARLCRLERRDAVPDARQRLHACCLRCARCRMPMYCRMLRGSCSGLVGGSKRMRRGKTDPPPAWSFSGPAASMNACMNATMP